MNAECRRLNASRPAATWRTGDDRSEITSVFSDFHPACPHLGSQLASYRAIRKIPLNRWSGLSVAGQLSPRWDKPSGSGMRQEVFRASIAEMESRQLAELVSDSSLSSRIRITRPEVDVTERSEPAGLFRLAFIRLFCTA